MILLPSHKNELYHKIQQEGLPPNQFEYKDVLIKGSQEKIVVIKHLASNFFFRIYDTIMEDFVKGKYNGYGITMSPGKTRYSEAGKFQSWETVNKSFTLWLEYLKREVNQPDKWGRLEQMSKVFDASLNRNDEEKLFTQNEYLLIERKISEIKASIPLLRIGQKAQSNLEHKLDLLLERSKTATKIDWYNLFIGYIITFALDHALDSDTVHQLWQLIKNSFNGFILMN